MPERAEPKVITLERFKHLVESGEAIPPDAVLRKAYVCEVIKAVDGDDRGIQIAISDETVDRDSDTLNVQGWKLGNYRKNPVVLFGHDYRSPPVAKAVKVFTEERRLKAVDHFVERDIYPFADTIFQMVKGGYLNAASVGFLPLKYERVDPESEDGRGRRGGIDFKQQELLEHSIVPVPSNPAALVEARSVLADADFKAYTKELERYLDSAYGEPMVLVSRAQLEAAWKILSPTSVRVPGRKDDYPPAIPPQDPPKPVSGGGGDAGGSGESEPTPATAGQRDAPLYNALIAHYDGLRNAHQVIAAKLKNLTGSKLFEGFRPTKDDPPADPGQAVYEIASLFAEHHDSMAKALGSTCDHLGAMLGDDGTAGAGDGGDKDAPVDAYDADIAMLFELDAAAHDEKAFVVQTLVCPKQQWKSVADAKAWASAHKFKTDKVDTTDTAYRFRQRDPGDFQRIRGVCINPGKTTPASMDKCKVIALGGPLKADVAPTSGVVPTLVRDALAEFRDEIGQELAALRRTLGTTERGVIGYRKHPLAAESTAWDVGKEVGAASVDDLKVMCAWFAGDGAKKGDYKLPHHHATGDHATVWRGVANAAARLSQTAMPASDIPGVKKHLAGHYRDFGKEAPWKMAPEQWEAYELTVRTVKSARGGDDLSDPELAHLLELGGFVDEAAALLSPTETDPIDDALQLLGVAVDVEEPVDLGDGVVLAPSELFTMLRDILPSEIGQATRRAIDAATGRLPD